MFPTDPSIADTKVATSTGTPHRELFRHEVEMRDVSCVVMGSPARMCKAVHMLPHRTGDQV
jgi:hypothetical protein